MSTTPNIFKIVVPTENKNGNENHKTIALHIEAAAKSHLEAAKHHEEENHDNAAKSTIVAQGHLAIASEAQREDAKNHANRN